MNIETLRELLKADENPRLEFKLRYDFPSQNKRGLQDEIAKDLIALFNTAGRDANDFAYLILGLGDKFKADGTRERESVRTYNYARKTFLDIVNARCYPELPNLDYEELEVDGNLYGVITVPPSRHVHVLTSPLVTDKKKLWRKNSVLVRHGDEVAVAGPEEIRLMAQQKERWVEQPRQPSRARLADEKALKDQAADFLRREMVFVDQECARTSERTISSIFVGRSFLGRERPFISGEKSAPSARVLGKPWSDVLEDLKLAGAVIVLGDPGTGKTVLMLNEVQRRCGEALAHLSDEETQLNDLEFAVYFHANRLASRVATHIATEAIVALLSERHQIFSAEFRLWLLHKLERGKILLVIDSLDEVSQANVGYLNENLAALARNATPCEMLFSARLVGYDAPPLPFASHWELLPFTPNQLDRAMFQWFSSDVKRFSNIKDMINRTPPLEDLLLNPLFCMLACKVWQQSAVRKSPDVDYVPVFNNRCDLYSSFIQQFRERWVQRLGRAGQTLTAAERVAFLPFLEQLAWHLWRPDPRRTNFTVTELYQVIDRVRSPGLVNRVDLLQDICEAGILTKLNAEDPATPYFFLHRTILEFLAAGHLANNLEDASQITGAASNFQEYIENPDARVMLWMLAGRLKNPDVFLKTIISWAVAEAEPVPGRAVDMPSPEIARILVDCLFECRYDTVEMETRRISWELITRGLDRLQRRKRRKEWQELADFGLIYRALYAVRKHEGGLSRSEQVLTLLDDVRSSEAKMHKGRMLPTEALNDLGLRLQLGYRSTCTTIRWTSVWITGRLFDRGKGGMEAEFFDNLVSLIKNDDNPHVRSIACRALVRVEHPQAFRILKEILEGENLRIAAAAAIGLERMMTKEAIEILMAKARSLSATDANDIHNPLPVALIGALEGVVSAAQQYGHERLFYDEALIEIFMRALAYPTPFTRSSAASALGKMGWKPAWAPLRKLVELADNGRPDVRLVRSSAAFACSKLCHVIDDSEFTEAAKFLQKRLLDPNEIPTVRRPVSDGLQVLARRGYLSEDLRSDLLQGAQGRDPLTVNSCILALMRFNSSEVMEDLTIMIREFDRHNRKGICELVRNQPTRVGLMLVLWVLENDVHLDVLFGALFAVQESCDKARNWRQYVSPDYVTDISLLTNLVERSLLLSQSEISLLLPSSLGALRGLCRLLYYTKNLEDRIRARVQARAVVLIHSIDEKIQASACGLLAYIGDRSNIKDLAELRERTESKKVRDAAKWASAKLSQRFS